MAKKKSFKQGLDNIIQESINLFKDEDVPVDNQKVKQLEDRIKLLERELYLWRTGKLTIEKFEKSLREHGLRYNPETNQIERAE